MMRKNPGNEIRDALQAVHDAAANYYRVHNSHCDDDSGMGDLDSAFDECGSGRRAVESGC